jgi:predicted protein tyrosine phosphatase
MKKEFKYPCAVEINSLTDDQGDALQEAFIKLGATLCDYYYYHDCPYYGVDYEGETQCYSNIGNFADKDEEVIVYTYDEIMSFVAELEQPTEVPVTKRQLKFPCAIAMSEINSQEVYDKVFNAFIEAGAIVSEDYRDEYHECGYNYFGVDYDKDTMHWDRLQLYKKARNSDNVAVYSLEDILGTTDQQEASSEPLGDVLADTPSVGIKEGVELTTEASEDYLEWGDWEVGDEVVFCGYVNEVHSHWGFVVGGTYTIGINVYNVVGPFNGEGYAPAQNYGFNFKKKLVTVNTEVNGWPQLSATSPEEKYLNMLMAIQDSEESTIGATTDISIIVNIKGKVFKLTRDEARKLSNDLYSIFEDEIV